MTCFVTFSRKADSALGSHEGQAEAIARAPLLTGGGRRGAPIAGVRGVPEELAFLHELEARAGDFAADELLIDAVERLSDLQAAPRCGGRVAHDVTASGAE